MAIKRNSEILAKDIRDKLRINYLSPTFTIQTSNGVTCTGDISTGCFVLNDTATNESEFYLAGSPAPASSQLKLQFPRDVKFTCIDKATAEQYRDRLFVTAYLPDSTPYRDQGNGVTIPRDKTIGWVYVYISPGTQITNIVLKPMITDDLEATYEDFIPYSDSLCVNRFLRTFIFDYVIPDDTNYIQIFPGPTTYSGTPLYVGAIMISPENNADIGGYVWLQYANSGAIGLRHSKPSRAFGDIRVRILVIANSV